MNLSSAIQYFVFLGVVTAFVQPLGGYLERVFSRKRSALDGLCAPVERFVYGACGIDPDREMKSTEYATSFILFGLVSTLLLFAILRLQPFLPWFYPAYHTTPLSPDLAMNTAVSFSTTTTWQAYSGESTMSYCSQMIGLCAQNFLAAGAGLAAGIAFIRGLSRQQAGTLGNFWADVTRALLRVLLPGALLGVVLLLWQGVPMNFHTYVAATTVEGHDQVIPQGPVAALEVIKNLGTNGGGFFNATGAHPYENPTPLANLLEMLAIVLLPAALTNTFGRMVGQPRQGWFYYVVMVVLFCAGIVFADHFEQSGNPLLRGVDAQSRTTAAGGNMEGKEVRFGIAGTVLTAAVTSNAATGSTNASDDSFSSLGGMVLLTNMLLGEVVFGGLGTGFYSMVMAAAIAVFLVGLMVGRTLEYLGKKIGPAENKMIVLYAMAAPVSILILSAIAVSSRAGLTGLTTNQGPHGLTTILFAYTSCFANNGQTFAGLNANTTFFNVTTALAMMVGRFAVAVPALTFAGFFARQRKAPASAGTLPTDSGTFGALVIACLLILTALSYLSVLALGPVLERLVFGT